MAQHLIMGICSYSFSISKQYQTMCNLLFFMFCTLLLKKYDTANQKLFRICILQIKVTYVRIMMIPRFLPRDASAERGYEIACRLSVRLSVCLSVCNV